MEPYVVEPYTTSVCLSVPILDKSRNPKRATFTGLDVTGLRLGSAKGGTGILYECDESSIYRGMCNSGKYYTGYYCRDEPSSAPCKIYSQEQSDEFFGGNSPLQIDLYERFFKLVLAHLKYQKFYLPRTPFSVSEEERKLWNHSSNFFASKKREHLNEHCLQSAKARAGQPNRLYLEHGLGVTNLAVAISNRIRGKNLEPILNSQSPLSNRLDSLKLHPDHTRISVVVDADIGHLPGAVLKNPDTGAYDLDPRVFTKAGATESERTLRNLLMSERAAGDYLWKNRGGYKHSYDPGLKVDANGMSGEQLRQDTFDLFQLNFLENSFNFLGQNWAASGDYPFKPKWGLQPEGFDTFQGINYRENKEPQMYEESWVFGGYKLSYEKPGSDPPELDFSSYIDGASIVFSGGPNVAAEPRTLSLNGMRDVFVVDPTVTSRKLDEVLKGETDGVVGMKLEGGWPQRLQFFKNSLAFAYGGGLDAAIFANAQVVVLSTISQGAFSGEDSTIEGGEFVTLPNDNTLTGNEVEKRKPLGKYYNAEYRAKEVKLCVEQGLWDCVRQKFKMNEGAKGWRGYIWDPKTRAQFLEDVICKALNSRPNFPPPEDPRNLKIFEEHYKDLKRYHFFDLVVLADKDGVGKEEMDCGEGA